MDSGWVRRCCRCASASVPQLRSATQVLCSDCGSSRRQRVLCAQTRHRRWAGDSGLLGLRVFWALKRQFGFPHDLAQMIVIDYLAAVLFHNETVTLRQERFQMMSKNFAIGDVRRLMDCIKFETRCLRLESGNMEIKRVKHLSRSHHLEEEDEECLHCGYWARVKRGASFSVFVLGELKSNLDPE